MIPQISKGLVISALLVSACGCSLGKKNVLFLTKTSFGVDIDSKPPTLDISYTRKEGTIAPRFESGEVLPQMASFSSRVGLPVSMAVGQSFATGSAAVILARYMGTAARPEAEESVAEELLTDDKVSAVDGTTATAQRYFFGTDTSFGIRVTFSPETGGYPDSVNLGYKRKELAFVPLTEDLVTKKVSLPSLIATAGLDSEFRTVQDSGVVYNQFFATGASARYLAASPEVRSTIGIRILRDSELATAVIRRTQADIELGEAVDQLVDQVDTLTDTAVVELCKNPPVEDTAVLRAGFAILNCDVPAQARDATKRRLVLMEDRMKNVPLWQAAFAAAEKKPPGQPAGGATPPGPGTPGGGAGGPTPPEAGPPGGGAE
jgi:hypothetical protein